MKQAQLNYDLQTLKNERTKAVIELGKAQYKYFKKREEFYKQLQDFKNKYKIK